MSLLVGQDSPLLDHGEIDAVQASQLDAIAFAANSIDIVYRRLADTLLTRQHGDEALPAIAMNN